MIPDHDLSNTPNQFNAIKSVYDYFQAKSISSYEDKI